MKIYLDNSIISEWLTFKSRGLSLSNFSEDRTKNPCIVRDIQAFAEILQMRSITFLYSFLIEMETEHRKQQLFYDFISQNKFLKVPTIGARICMTDKDLPEDSLMEIGECQSYFASYVKKLNKNLKDRNDQMRYIREKFCDPIHIDSAVKAKADIFLTSDYKLLRLIYQHSDLRTFLASKIGIFSPSKFIEQHT